MTLRIGIDYRPAMLLRSGIGRYVRELVSALAALENADASFELFAAMMRRPEFVTAVPRASGVRLARGRFPGRLQQLLRLPVERWTGPLDVFHATDYVPVISRSAGYVFTVHDLGFVRDPSCHETRNVRRLTAVTEAAVRRAGVLVVPSRVTRDDVVEHFAVDSDRVVVAPHGVAPAWFGIEHKPGERPLVLAVGTVEPRKNHARLLRAFEAVRADGVDAELVLVGRRGWLCDEVFELLDSPGLRSCARHVGEVSDEVLHDYVARAAVCAYPSTLEGFGMPVLEAMAAGVPVVTSDVGATKEVAGDAAILVDPLSVDAIAAGLGRVLGDAALRAELARRGRERAREFTWADSARRHLEAYRRA